MRVRNSERALLDSDREGPSARRFTSWNPGSDETVALRPEITPQIAHRRDAPRRDSAQRSSPTGVASTASP